MAPPICWRTRSSATSADPRHCAVRSPLPFGFVIAVVVSVVVIATGAAAVVAVVVPVVPHVAAVAVVVTVPTLAVAVVARSGGLRRIVTRAFADGRMPLVVRHADRHRPGAAAARGRRRVVDVVDTSVAVSAALAAHARLRRADAVAVDRRVAVTEPVGRLIL